MHVNAKKNSFSFFCLLTTCLNEIRQNHCILVSEDTQKNNSRQIDLTESLTGKKRNPFKELSLAWKLLRRNFTSPEENIKGVLKGFKESRPYVLNPKYSTPTSLPLYFYFGYQLLQEYSKVVECGPVSIFYILIKFINHKSKIKRIIYQS